MKVKIAFTESPSERGLRRLALLAVICLSLTVFLGKSYETTLQAMDSSVHARLALQATSSGVIPSLPIGVHDTSSSRWKDGGFNDHPFVPFYLNGWVMRLFGPTAWSARLLPGLFSVGCVLITYWIALTYGSASYALLSAFILATTPEFILYGSRFHLDTPLTFFILASFLFWMRRRPALAGLFAGLGVWIKSPVALLILPTLGIHYLTEKKRERIFSLCATSAIAALMVFLLWGLTATLGGWAVVADYWQRQVWGTAVGGRGYGGGADFGSFFRILSSKYWPWLPLFLYGIFNLIRNWRRSPSQLRLCGMGLAILVGVVSSMKFRFLHYFLPTYPFVALIAAWPIASWLEKRRVGLYQSLVALSLLLMAVLLSTPVALAPEMFPSLKRFNAIIQSYGGCREPVLMILGNQPYGSQGDYAAEIGFYTGRGVRAVSCQEVGKWMNPKAYPWVIVSGENFKNCFSENVRKQYSRIFKFGNQYLLSSLVPKDESIDLTVLERELKAVRDCAPEALPRDRYHEYD